MTILNTLYVSGGTSVIFTTLEFNDGVNHFYIVDGYDDITVRLEDNSVAEFEAFPLQVARPARNADGTQDLQIAICNVAGMVSTKLKEMIEADRKGTVICRFYNEQDLTVPAEPPLRLTVKGGTWTAMQADIVAGYMNILDTAWPRKLFNPITHPGLRYIA